VNVLIDTPIWSYAYRRTLRTRREQSAVDTLGKLIADQQAWLIGPVRQEILCGFNEARQFVELRAVLRAFTDLVIETPDYEFGAELHNLCRHKGVQGSSTDLLLCAMAVRRDASVFTTDNDFSHYKRITGVKLYKPVAR
jgi:predicted nucleic acid-binding protein